MNTASAAAPTPRRGLPGPLQTLFDTVERIEAGLCFVILSVLCIAVLLMVISRNLLGESLSWSLELSRFLFVWLCWLGAAIGIRRRAHFGLESLTARLPGPVVLVVRTVVFVIVALFFVLLAVYGAQFAWLNAIQLSTSMKIPMSWANASVPVGGALMLLHWIEVHLRLVYHADDEEVQ